jgi:putative ABC transport system permease protein
MAEKYFGESDPIGKSLEMTGLWGDTSVSVTVTGLLEPIPDASHFHPRILVSWATLNAAFRFSEQMRDNWSGGAFRAYLKVPEGTPPPALAERFTTQALERAGDRWSQGDVSFRLQPITDIHLHSNLDFELEPNGSAATVYLFLGVALMILILAGVNFVNLALARSVERTMEVGVRKTIGAGRGQIVRQFLAEALLMAGGALVLALGLAAAALPLFRSLTGIEVSLGGLVAPLPLAILGSVTLIAALGSAAYPAFVLSRFDPAQVFGGGGTGETRAAGPRTSWLRHGLVVFQFAIAVILASGTVVAYWQLDYLRTADLGFAEEQVVTVPKPPSAGDRESPFVREAEQQPGVRAVARASASLPARLLRHAEFAFAGQGVPAESRHSVRFVTVGPNFFEALGVTAVAGRTFEPGRAGDSSAVVLNRAALEALATDLPKDQRTALAATGRTLDSSVPWLVESPRVVGVVEDVHLGTFYDAIKPTIFVRSPLLRDTYYLQIDASRPDQALAEARAVWQEVYPDAPFAYTFADQSFASAYRAERRTGTLFGAFTALALFVAGLGLFGLTAFAVRQRRREVGIRKAFGASIEQLVGHLSWDYIRLVSIGIVIAIPVAYVALSRWLNTFAYHVPLSPSVFVGAGGSALAVALLAVSTQALRAARIDPATTLRDE